MKYTFFHKPLAYFPKKRTIGIKMEILFWHIFIEINQNTFYNSCYKIRHLYMMILEMLLTSENVMYRTWMLTKKTTRLNQLPITANIWP